MPGNLGARSSETSFPHFKTILLKSAVVIFRQQFKAFNSNNFTLSSTSSVQNAWPIKINTLYTFFYFSKYSFTFLGESDWITACVFFKTNYFILVILQAVAGGNKCCFRQSILPVTA